MPSRMCKYFKIENKCNLKYWKRNKSKICLSLMITLLILTIIFCVTIFIIVPLIFMSSEYLQRLLMFSNFGLTRDSKSFKSPNKSTRNFYLTFDDERDEKISLGIWHMLPHALENESDFDKALLNPKYAVLLHFHGSGETRKDSKGMFHVLRTFFQVIAFDYRDYGDSTPATLSENAVAKDAINIFNWIRNRTDNDIYVWGHSLGTPLSTLTIANLENTTFLPTGVILEAPMTTMREEIPLHPFGKVFAWLPWFESTILNPLQANGFLFETRRYILKVNCPILILHAEDDSIIPYKLGKKLSEIASTERTSKQGNVTYIQLPAKFNFDHFRIYKYKELPKVIKRFIDECNNFKYTNKTML